MSNLKADLHRITAHLINAGKGEDAEVLIKVMDHLFKPQPFIPEERPTKSDLNRTIQQLFGEITRLQGLDFSLPNLIETLIWYSKPEQWQVGNSGANRAPIFFDHGVRARQALSHIEGLTKPKSREPSAAIENAGPESALAPAVLPHVFVQPVPDHCDRIIWKGQYFHLPILYPMVRIPTETMEQEFQSRYSRGYNKALDDATNAIARYANMGVMQRAIQSLHTDNLPPVRIRSTLDDARDAGRWRMLIRAGVTYHESDGEAHVLASKRIWYHATDDQEHNTLPGMIDAMIEEGR